MRQPQMNPLADEPAGARLPLQATGRGSGKWDGSGFAERTEVATTRGAVRVDQLEIGHDLEYVQDGAWRLARIERHAFASGALRWSHHALPVRIEAGALGRGLPRCDLILGGEQRIVLDGASWPARVLVTGSTIRFQPAGAPLVLFLLSPGSHAMQVTPTLIAAGAPCSVTPSPTALPGLDVAALACLRLRLQRQAGQQPGTLLGHADRVDHGGIAGWATDAAHPLSPVCLEVRVAGTLVGTVIANGSRPDLGHAGAMSVRCGFEWRPASVLPRGRGVLVTLHRVGDGAVLPGCPVLLPARLAGPALLDRAMKIVPADGGLLAREITAGLATRAAI